MTEQINKLPQEKAPAAIKGKIHSIQSMGTLDGPGVRFVAFLQGCNLRCGCCHNPDTWYCDESREYTAGELVERAVRYREYFGNEGGITLSGGEPLLQAEFAEAVFSLSHDAGINTCIDTSGSIMNEKVKCLLEKTDRVLLDIKYTDDELYRRYVGCSIDTPLEFLRYLNEKCIPTTIRQVIIPTLNDNKENILRLKQIISSYQCIDKTELLPFRKICEVKYEKLNLPFPFAGIPEASHEKMKGLEALLNR